MLNLVFAWPEIILLITACVALLVDLFTSNKYKYLTLITILIGLLAALVTIICQYQMPTTYAFYGMYVHDNIASILKIGILIIGIISLVYSRRYIKVQKMPQGEYFLMALFSIIGMFVLVSANSLLVLFLGLELLSLPTYAMVALKRDSGVCAEAAIKYYIMGAMASGILLYGISMLYGLSGSLIFSDIALQISALPATDQLLAILACVFIVSGVMFKLGAAPFHMWAPDVYEGAPTAVSLFISGAPKIAGLGMLIRFLIDTMPALGLQWQHLLIVIAILSMAVGNIAAIRQTNLKRMLAYSSIAHMGYMSLGILAMTPAGYSAALFYMLMYALMAIGAFAILVLLSNAGFEAEQIADLRGLNSRNPWLALMMLILMFSMAGIPPTVGFFAKLGVLEALISVHLIWLAALALIFAVMGAYYYLAIVKVMYFEEPTNTNQIAFQWDSKIAITINGLAVLMLGLFPTAIINLCRAAF